MWMTPPTASEHVSAFRGSILHVIHAVTMKFTSTAIIYIVHFRHLYFDYMLRQRLETSRNENDSIFTLVAESPEILLFCIIEMVHFIVFISKTLSIMNEINNLIL